jgi:hypothetical protein
MSELGGQSPPYNFCEIFFNRDPSGSALRIIISIITGSILLGKYDGLFPCLELGNEDFDWKNSPPETRKSPLTGIILAPGT